MTKRTTSYILPCCLVLVLLTGWINAGTAAPKPEKGGTHIAYYAYEVMYNPEYRIPKWVRYTLTAAETDGPYSRSGLNFVPDPSLSLPQAEDSDYRNSGWSIGHMAPAGDFKWCERAMQESFYFTNCCPQDISLNNGQWKTLEEKVRAGQRSSEA